MARILFLMLFALATLLHGSVAQTRHVVGDSTGWTIPFGGATTYTVWASGKTFVIGDSLVFNFINGHHDVAKVTKPVYDACNGANTLFTLTSNPATVTLNETGEHYYICTFGSHCSLGQKLAINVVNKASTTPSPQPNRSGSPPTASPVPAPTQAPSFMPTPSIVPTPSQTPSTVPSPVPTPSIVPSSAPALSVVPAPTPSPITVTTPAPGPFTRPVTFTVGDNLGWTVPTNGAAAYTSWASGKNFRIGDILVFNYQSNTHNVEELTKENFDSCNSTSPLATYSTPPARVTLNKSGAHYFICGIPGHCQGGQKLAINVIGNNNNATSPSHVTTPPSTATSPTRSPSGFLAPHPHSRATSLGFVGISVTFLSLAATFFY